MSKTTAPADKAAPAAHITAWPTAQGAADKARLRGVEMLLLLDERVRVGEVAALRVARQLLATLLFLGANSRLFWDSSFENSKKCPTRQNR